MMFLFRAHIIPTTSLGLAQGSDATALDHLLADFAQAFGNVAGGRLGRLGINDTTHPGPEAVPENIYFCSMCIFYPLPARKFFDGRLEHIQKTFVEITTSYS